MLALLERLTHQGGYMDAEPAPTGGAAPAAAAAPEAAAPAAGTTSPAAATDAAKPLDNLVGDAGKEIAPVFNKEDATKYLTAKGQKAEDLAKLDDAALQKQFDAAKTAETAAAAEPVKIELKAPEGFTVDQTKAAEFTQVITDTKLSAQERADKLIAMHVAAMKAATDAPQTQWREMQKTWQDEIKADPVMGGKNLEATTKVFADTFAAYAKSAGPEAAQAVRQAMAFTGVGNNPAFARFMHFVGQVYSEGKPAAGGALADGKGSSFKTAVASMYPSAAKSQP